MTEVGRAFLAVAPPDDVLDAVEERVAPLRNRMVGIRWTTRPQWHLTLQFLGKVPDLEALVDTVGVAVQAMPPMQLHLGGAGAFPRPLRARVLWVGLAEGAATLAELYRAATDATGPLGYRVESRPFHAHLTLARIPDPADVRALVEAIGDEPVGPAWTATEVVCFQSTLRRTGAEYTELTRLPLST